MQREGRTNILKTMGLSHRILHFANLLTPVVFSFGGKLPTYYDSEWIWLSRNTWSSLYWRYEPQVASVIRTKLSRGATFWDVGANVGWLSLFAAKVVGPQGHVVSFEPSPDVFALLRVNAQGCGSVKIFQYGIGNTDGMASFAMQGASSSSSFIEDVTKINRHYLPNQPIEKIAVKIRKLDTLLNDEISPAPTLVKIDVEGFELEVLKGAVEMMSSCRPALLVEIHPPQIVLSGGSEDELFQLLERHQYRWRILDRNPPLYSILAEPIG